MTRINSNLDPRTLKRMHLVAELREITMVPAALRRSLKTRLPVDIAKGIPKKFTLNKGHVTFFYDKIAFLHGRFIRLAQEMERRGYTPDWQRAQAFYGFDTAWMNDWESSAEDDAIVTERINFRISQKPHLYID
jgi:deoxyribonuclease (pyrimidine dimer)